MEWSACVSVVPNKGQNAVFVLLRVLSFASGCWVCGCLGVKNQGTLLSKNVECGAKTEKSKNVECSAKL